jgi:hypothetical protein
MELQVSFDALESKYAAFKENINAMREECDAFTEGKKLPHPESNMKIMLENCQVFQRLTRYSPKEEILLRSEQEELKDNFNFEELIRESELPFCKFQWT